MKPQSWDPSWDEQKFFWGNLIYNLFLISSVLNVFSTPLGPCLALFVKYQKYQQLVISVGPNLSLSYVSSNLRSILFRVIFAVFFCVSSSISFCSIRKFGFSNFDQFWGFNIEQFGTPGLQCSCDGFALESLL